MYSLASNHTYIIHANPTTILTMLTMPTTYPYKPPTTSHPKPYYSFAFACSTVVVPWPAHNNTALPNCLLKSTFSTSCVSSTSPH